MNRDNLMVLSSLGFCGDLAWVLNEEGSGAKYYKSSVYYPDSRKKPQTNSGVTIDPGLDLGSGDKTAVKDTLNFYASEGLLSVSQMSLLREAVGLKKFAAIDWMDKNAAQFKNHFLVPETTALFVMDKYCAPKYWTQLDMPGLKSIPGKMKIAVHTALLSQSYNRGPLSTKALVQAYVQRGNWPGLAEAIKALGRATESTMDDKRRNREADLILNALEQGENFKVDFSDVNPRPVTTIPFKDKDSLRKHFAEQMTMKPVPENPINVEG